MKILKYSVPDFIYYTNFPDLMYHNNSPVMYNEVWALVHIVFYSGLIA